MKTYIIPIIFQSVKEYTVEAKNLQEAIDISIKMFFSEKDENYIEDSYEIDGSIEDSYPDESFTTL
jgi:hypothetical protein